MRSVLPIIIFAWGVVIDQFSKLVVSGYFGMTLNQNFALGLDIPMPALCHSVVLVVLGWWVIKHQTSGVGVSLVLAGGFSNLLDRMILGGVRDWMMIPLIGGKNNLADWLVVVGIIGIVVNWWKYDRA